MTCKRIVLDHVACTFKPLFMKWHLCRWCRHGTSDKNLLLFSQQVLAEIFKDIVNVAEVVNFPFQAEGYDEVEGGYFTPTGPVLFQCHVCCAK